MSSAEHNIQGEGASPPLVSVDEQFRLQHKRELYQLRKVQWHSFVDGMSWRPHEFDKPDFMTKPEWKLVMRAWETSGNRALRTFDPNQNCSFATCEYVSYVGKLRQLADQLEKDWDAFCDGDSQSDEAEAQLLRRLEQMRYNSKRLQIYFDQYVPDRDLMWLKWLPRTYLRERQLAFVDPDELNKRGEGYEKSLVRNFVNVMVEFYNPD